MSTSSLRKTGQIINAYRILLRYAKKTQESCTFDFSNLLSILPTSQQINLQQYVFTKEPKLLTDIIKQQFRIGSKLKKRSHILEARATAMDLLEYIDALHVQTTLINTYKGTDVDTPSQRRNVARFIGLDMPAQTPQAAAAGAASLAAASKVAEKYRASVEAKTRAGVTKLEGIDALKAQLYGVSHLKNTSN